MGKKDDSIQYPRNRFNRGLVKIFGRLLLPLAAKIQIIGRENFPTSGPVILISNHAAVMEPVLMAVYSPKPLEFLGSIDVPHEPLTQKAVNFYQMIPVFRGKPERKSLKMALDVLNQKGFLAIFPEGGLWNPGGMTPKSGVSFLSHRSGAVVLPVACVGSEGALNAIARFKRPEIQMIIGEAIPAFAPAEGEGLKDGYNRYAQQVMDRVFDLLPEEVVSRYHDVQNEEFTLIVEAFSDGGQPVEIPIEKQITEAASLALLFHRPSILKIFRVNLDISVQSLEHLHQTPMAGDINRETQQVINYLEDEENGNPYLLTYRFGFSEGKKMLIGLKELNRLSGWAVENNRKIGLKPVRRFFSQSQNRVLEQVVQGEFDHWR